MGRISDTGMNRREFLQLARGKVPSKRIWLRPPCAVDEELFLNLCTKCGECAKACHYGSIKLVEGRPVIVPKESPCYFCEGFPCRSACVSGALGEVKFDSRICLGFAGIDKKQCSAWNGSNCIMCYTKCPFLDKAIVLQDLRPVVVPENCTGCGICENICFLINGNAYIRVIPGEVLKG